MKTPRDVLFHRHREVESKLNAARHQALASLEREPKRERISFREFLWSLRWHLTGMSAVWLFIMFLNLDGGNAPGVVADIPRAQIPSPQIIMAALRENRRQLSEMIETNSPTARPLELFLPRPRSERRIEAVVI